ncbi:MAG: cytochrome c biogenesis protein CcdA [Ignavibacteriaceae bacterium]|nr:cytochrome c biogenesis protein CcdA [Ignavibacteriaceae bacterium]
MKKYFVLLFVLMVSNSAFPQIGKPLDLVKIKAYQSFDKIVSGTEFKIAAKINIDPQWHINSNKPYEDFLIPSVLSIDTSSGFRLFKIVYPKPEDRKLAFSDKPLSVYEKEIYAGALVMSPSSLKPGTYKLPVVFDYQSCNDKTCLPPNSVSDTLTIEIVDRQSAVKEVNQDIFENIDLTYTSAVPAVIKSNSDDNSISSRLEKSGLVLSLIFVFIGGLALNLTPCVYPLIPITIGYFGGQSEGKTSRLVMMGVLFVVGLAITYSVIGVVTALSGSIFGALLQNTYVILFIALIFLVLSLSMFGVYEFKLPDALVNKAGGAKSGLFGAFFMGLTMGIVAAPCIGPFVLGLVTYVAAKGDPWFGFILFFDLAVGLGVPYLLLAIFSGKIKKLPRAGEWMEAVKHIFGFLLIGMAIYFVNPILPKIIQGFPLPIFMIIAALYLILFDKLANKIKGFRIFKIVFSLVLIIVAVYALVPSNKKSISWQHYNSGIASASLSGSKGMIIDFYADWCIPCKELDANTFSDERVITIANNFVTVKADMTKSLSPDVEALRNKYNIVGVPTVLIIDSKGNEIQRLTGFVNADEFVKLLESVD